MYESLCFNGEDIGVKAHNCRLAMSLMDGEERETWLDTFANDNERSLIRSQLSLKDGKLAVLSEIYVDSTTRRRGYATKLIEEVFSSNASDASVFALIVDLPFANNFSLVEFYERFGFKLADETSSHSFPIMYKINK